MTSATGEKFGKSTGGGSLWLDADLTSPYAFYQHWINVDDRDVAPYLRYFTFLLREEIEELDRATSERPQAREGQRRLAQELTTLVHGGEEAERVEAASRALFGRGDLAALDAATLTAALAEAPHTAVGTPLPSVVDLLALTGLDASKSAARRTFTHPDLMPATEDLLHGRWLVLRKGKRSLAGVEVTPG